MRCAEVRHIVRHCTRPEMGPVVRYLPIRDALPRRCTSAGCGGERDTSLARQLALAQLRSKPAGIPVPFCLAEETSLHAPLWITAPRARRHGPGCARRSWKSHDVRQAVHPPPTQDGRVSCEGSCVARTAAISVVADRGAMARRGGAASLGPPPQRAALGGGLSSKRVVSTRVVGARKAASTRGTQSSARCDIGDGGYEIGKRAGGCTTRAGYGPCTRDLPCADATPALSTRAHGPKRVHSKAIHARSAYAAEFELSLPAPVGNPTPRWA